MSRCIYENFDITIRGQESPYGLTAAYRGMLAEGAVASDIHQPEWKELLRGLANTIHTPAPGLICQAGTRLFRDVMTADIRDLWVQAREQLDRKPENGLRLRLAIQPPAVASLPWELLFDPDRNMAFGAQGRTPLLRIENQLRQIGPARAIRAQLPLKVLLVAPEDPTGQIDTDHELEHIQSLLDAVGRASISVTSITGRISIVDLRRALGAERPDILHVISHGEPEGILFWRNNRPSLATSAALRTAVAHAPSVKFVFLNACLAGLDSEQHAFTSVGTQILQTGVPAVIAMQFPIRDDAAIDFAYFLYEELLRGRCPGAIDYATASARSQLFSLGPGDVSFATPILWQNSPDGIVFQFAGRAEDLDNEIDGRTNRSDIKLDSFHLESERAWLVEIDAGMDLGPLPREVQFLAREWQRSVDALHRFLDQLAAIVQSQNLPALSDKYSEYLAEKAALLRMHSKISDLSM